MKIQGLIFLIHLAGRPAPKLVGWESEEDCSIDFLAREKRPMIIFFVSTEIGRTRKKALIAITPRQKEKGANENQTN